MLNIFQVATKPRKKRQKNDEEGDEGEDGKGSHKRSRKSSTATASPKRPKKLKLKPGDAGYDPYDFTSDEDDEEDEPVPPQKSHDPKAKSCDQDDGDSMEVDQPGARTVTLTEQRYEVWIQRDILQVSFTPFTSILYRLTEFRSAVVKAFSTEHSQSLPVDQLTELVNSGAASRFSSSEVMAALEQMQDANQVMVSEGVVFLIWKPSNFVN